MRATVEQVRAAIFETEKAIAGLGSYFQQPEVVLISGYPFHRHLYYDDLLLSYLKCVRAVSSLNACVVLLESGFVFEVHALCRSIDECSEDVTFFAKPPTSQLPATQRRLYGNLPLSEERDPYSALLVTG
jgi:hypothetical protein